VHAHARNQYLFDIPGKFDRRANLSRKSEHLRYFGCYVHVFFKRRNKSWAFLVARSLQFSILKLLQTRDSIPVEEYMKILLAHVMK